MRRAAAPHTRTAHAGSRREPPPSTQNTRRSVPTYARSGGSRRTGRTVAGVRLIDPARCAAVPCVAAALSLAPAARATPWQRPVQGPVVRAFGLSADRFAAGQHRGVDLAAPLGAPVRAACGGRVRFAGRVPGGGLTVSVGCGSLVATYQHLGAVAVRRGQLLAPGGTVGGVGRSGRPRGRRPHLHLGARERVSGRYVDPLTLLGAAPRAAPPVASAPRRPVPLGPAPRPAPRRPIQVPPVPPVRPVRPVVEPRGAPAPGPPVLVWIGLAAFGLGLPLSGLVTVRRRRRSTGAREARARRWAWAHR
jgi:murein DD-endopeptidase MepM/ murein hydrolase activator NlpD